MPVNFQCVGVFLIAYQFKPLVLSRLDSEIYQPSACPFSCADNLMDSRHFFLNEVFNPHIAYDDFVVIVTDNVDLTFGEGFGYVLC